MFKKNDLGNYQKEDLFFIQYNINKILLKRILILKRDFLHQAGISLM